MRKTSLWLFVAVMGLAASARAANHTAAGCGLGTMIFDAKKTKAALILAATTNGSFGNQTFGISSETLGCTSDGVVKADKKLDVYAEVNMRRLSREMAQGRGETLEGLAALMGCRDAATKQAFFKLAQARYERILPNADTDASAMLGNLKAEMAQDQVLRTL